MNAELSEGSTDGKYKKVRPDTSNLNQDSTYQTRADLDDRYYGIHEKQVKVAPDGLLHATPAYVATPAANTSRW
jgi:hypothetical protein